MEAMSNKQSNQPNEIQIYEFTNFPNPQCNSYSN